MTAAVFPFKILKAEAKETGKAIQHVRVRPVVGKDLLVVDGTIAVLSSVEVEIMASQRHQNLNVEIAAQ